VDPSRGQARALLRLPGIVGQGQPLEDPIIQRQHLVRARLGPEQLLELPQPGGMLCGDIVRLAEVFVEMIELPRLGAELAPTTPPRFQRISAGVVDAIWISGLTRAGCR
jgi:hypothetical protein